MRSVENEECGKCGVKKIYKRKRLYIYIYIYMHKKFCLTWVVKSFHL